MATVPIRYFILSTMPTVDKIQDKTEDFLANDSDEEQPSHEVPTQFPTQCTDEDLGQPFMLAQTQDLLQPRTHHSFMPQVATKPVALLSQLSTDSRWDSNCPSGFTQLEQMMQLQSQAQRMSYPNYPPHLPGVPFGFHTTQAQGNNQTEVPTTQKPAAKPKKKDGKGTAAQKALAKKKDRETKKTRGPAFKETEGFALLDTIERRNTIAGKVNWELVCSAMEQDGWPKRGVDATKRRYWEIIGKAQKMPTGDPDVPKLLLRAREVHFLVRANNGVGDPSEESAAIQGEILEVTGGATGVRTDQVAGEDDASVESKVVTNKTPNKKSFIARRVSMSASKQNIFETVTQLQASQMAEARRMAMEEKAEARRIRNEDREERRAQNKLWLKLGAMAVTAFLGNGSDDATKNRLKNDLLKSVIAIDSSDEKEDDESDDSLVDLNQLSKKRRI